MNDNGRIKLGYTLMAAGLVSLLTMVFWIANTGRPTLVMVLFTLFCWVIWFTGKTLVKTKSSVLNEAARAREAEAAATSPPK